MAVVVPVRLDFSVCWAPCGTESRPPGPWRSAVEDRDAVLGGQQHAREDAADVAGPAGNEDTLRGRALGSREGRGGAPRRPRRAGRGASHTLTAPLRGAGDDPGKEGAPALEWCHMRGYDLL